MIWNYNFEDSSLQAEKHGLHFEIDYYHEGSINDDKYVVVVSRNGKKIDEYFGHGFFHCLSWAYKRAEKSKESDHG